MKWLLINLDQTAAQRDISSKYRNIVIPNYRAVAGRHPDDTCIRGGSIRPC